MVKLKGLVKVTARGRVYWYAWRGGPRIMAPHGTAAFAAEFAAHHATRKGGEKDRISSLIVDWKQSSAWTLPPERGGLALTTRATWSKCLDEIHGHFGTLRIEAFEDERAARRNIKRWLERWHDRPRMHDHMKQALSVLLSFAVERELITRNPCYGIASRYRGDRAQIIWTADDIAAFETVASRELVWALKLACLTGLRQGDLLRLSWSHISDLAIDMPTSKSRVRGAAPRVATIPLHAELKTLLAEIPKRATTVLTNQAGLPWRGFKRSWNTAMGRTDLKGRLHFHDARGTFATRAYLAGLKVEAIARILGWSAAKVERIIDRYVRRDLIMLDEIKKLDGKS